MNDYRLSDLIDLTIVQKMADAHYRAAGMPIGIIDAIDSSILVGAGWQDICVKFHRANPASLRHCQESDDYVKGHLAEGEACDYKCQNGLWDIGMPIVVAGSHLATMFLGQFFYEDETPDREFFIQLAHEFGFDVDDYLAALDRVPVFSREKVDYILAYDKALVSFIADLAGHSLSKIKADQIIHENERKFHAIFDHTYEYIGLLSVDGRMLAANRTALRFAGIEEIDVIDKPFWETRWWAHSPELQEEVRVAVKKAAEGEFIRFEATHRSVRGNLHYVDFSLKPVADEAGKVVLLIPEGRNITDRKLVEEALRISEANNRTILDSVNDAIFIHTIDGKVIDVNEKMLKMYKVSREEAISMTIANDFSAPDNPLETVGELWESVVRGEKRIFEWKARRPHDNSFFPVEVFLKKITLNNVDAILATVRDITERKWMEEELRRSEAMLTRAQEMAHVGHWERDLLTQELRWSDEIYRIFDLKPERAVHRQVFFDHVHPEDQSRVEKAIEDAIAGVNPYNEIFRIVRPDGAIRWLQSKGEVTRTPDGTPLRIFGTMFDITERKRMEEELRKSRDELERRVEERTAQLKMSEEIARGQLAEIEAYYNMTPVGLAILDRHLRFVRVNQKLAEWDGIPVHEHLGRPVRDVSPKKFADWFGEVAHRILESGEPINDMEITTDTPTAPGIEKTGRVNCFPLTDQSGQRIGIGCIIEEITEKKRLEEQLRQAQKMEALGIFAGGIAHDFNNILAAVIGFCELARDKVPETSSAHRYLDTVLSAGLRGRDLVRQILTFSRQTGQEPKALQLGSLVRETVKLLRASIPTTIHIRVNAKNGSHFILADPTQMQQVLMNLCANAAHAMSKSGGTIAIDVNGVSFSSPAEAPDPALNPGHYVKLSVADTGEGMTAEVVGRIFDPFFTTKNPAEGTGLGLPVVHGIVANHGGAIRVWSEPGRGSIFTVYLPEYRGHESRTSDKREADIPHGHENVLFIEDEESLAQMGGEMLTKLGYRVTCKTGGREALALIRQDPRRFDLVITDQTMPEMTGLQLAKELRIIRPELPVILCTGFSSQVDAESAAQAGIDAFVMKPLTRKELAKAVREVLDR